MRHLLSALTSSDDKLLCKLKGGGGGGGIPSSVDKVLETVLGSEVAARS